MPIPGDVGIDCGFKISADGLIHTAQRLDPPKGRRDIHNESSTEDPRVCLSCPLPECSGERACYLMRKKEMEKK